MGKGAARCDTDASPPRSRSTYHNNIMSDPKKQERDFTPEVEAVIPAATDLAKVVHIILKADHEGTHLHGIS